jgi:hypothetical protein
MLEKNIKRIIYFISSPFTKRGYKRYGIEKMTENGFDVYVYDFSPIINPRLFEVGFNDTIAYEKHLIFYEKNAAISAIKKLSTNDFVICTLFYTKRQYWIYKALSQTVTLYAVIVSLAIPDRNMNRSISAKIKQKNKSLLSLYQMMINVPFRAVFSQYRGIRGPDYIIAGGINSIKYYQLLIPNNDARVIWTHGLDYDIYLQYKSNLTQKLKRGVFIDAGAMVVGGDFMASHYTKDKNVADDVNYFPNLRKYFSDIERRSTCGIIIAAHPGYVGSDYPDEFGRRLTVEGKTCELIQNSDFVITHNSTAISFAILMYKPVIFITTDNYISFGLGESICYMADSLGKTVTNIDEKYEINIDTELLIDTEKYIKYKNEYLKVNGTEDINSWQILSNRISKL